MGDRQVIGLEGGTFLQERKVSADETTSPLKTQVCLLE